VKMFGSPAKKVSPGLAVALGGPEVR